MAHESHELLQGEARHQAGIFLNCYPLMLVCDFIVIKAGTLISYPYGHINLWSL